jgi:hypothetical protein
MTIRMCECGDTEDGHADTGKRPCCVEGCPCPEFREVDDWCEEPFLNDEETSEWKRNGISEKSLRKKR